ncbi:MAG: hypothetical protein M1831_004856 [Alyxoria varia]|nr:MAG: hypothetical protein M1831_004856 [Alyxoria varia]
MDLKSIEAFLTHWLGPSPAVVIITFLLALASPLLLHTYLYRSKARTHLPAFLLVGPSGAGKTSLMTLLERGAPAATHTSQTTLTVECSLPLGKIPASSRFRSANDPSNQVHRKFLLIDTPGHGKLRHLALDSATKPQNIKGIVFVVDAAAVSADTQDGGGLTEAAQYLSELLLTLQRRASSGKSSRGSGAMPVLIACNKLDLFTALPAKLVRSSLESEVTKLRTTRTQGLLDSGIGMDEDLDEQEALGGGGEGPFKFDLMEEYEVPVEVLGGNVTGADGSDAGKWWDWIGKHL